MQKPPLDGARGVQAAEVLAPGMDHEKLK